MNAVEVVRLTKRFRAVTAVDDLSFVVPSGSVTGFVGPNGAGKTTTLRALLGLVRPSSGRALVAGRPYRELAEPGRAVGAVLEAGGAHPWRTARNHLLGQAKLLGTPADRVDEVLDVVGLTAAAGRRLGGFSLGMRQRLALAAALLGRPPVLVLDEPANGLDPAGIHWLRGLLRAHADAGGTVLISSHQLAELSRVADHLVVVQQGRLVTQGPVAELNRGARDLEALFLELTAGGSLP